MVVARAKVDGVRSFAYGLVCEMGMYPTALYKRQACEHDHPASSKESADCWRYLPEKLDFQNIEGSRLGT